MLEYNGWKVNCCKRDGVPTLILSLEIVNHPLYCFRRTYKPEGVDCFFFLGHEVVDLSTSLARLHNIVKQVKYEV